MPSALEVAEDHYAEQKALVQATAAAGVQMWQQVDPFALTASWTAWLSRMFVILRGAQIAAASTADPFTEAVLSAQAIAAPPVGKLAATAFSGVASDGRPLESLLMGPVIAAKMAIGRGETIPRAMATGQARLEMTLRTQVADAGRVADGVATVARPRLDGYTRIVKLPACSRCLVLAGRVYRYDEAFDRHPQCDCTRIPTDDEEDAEFTTDAKEYFESISESDQDKIFTKAGAQAIRDGADINQVVNSRRGASGLAPAGARITKAEQEMLTGGKRGRLRATTVYGQEVFITSEGTSTRGLAGQRLMQRGGVVVEDAETVTRRSKDGDVQRTVGRRRAKSPRLMPESIYQLAENREDAIRLLQRFGYIL